MRFGPRSKSTTAFFAIAEAVLATLLAAAAQTGVARADLQAEGAPGEVRGELPAGVLDLSGEWQVAGLEETRADLVDPGLEAAWRRVELPASWRELADGAEADLVLLQRAVTWDEGFRAPEPSAEWGVLVGAARFGAYRLYVDGHSVGGHGKLLTSLAPAGEDSKASPAAGATGRWPAPATRVFAIPREILDRERPEDPGGLRLTLVFRRAAWWRDRLANRGGPVGDRILIGDLDALRAAARSDRLRDRRRSLPAVVFGALLLVIGGYHLLLFVLRRQSLEYLWLGWMAVGCGVGTWVVDGLVGYDLALSEGWRRRSVAVLGHLGLVLVLQLIRSLVPTVRRRWLGAYMASHVGLGLLMAVLPLAWVGSTEILRAAWGLPAVLLVLGLLVRRAFRRRADERAVWLGVVVVPLGILLETVLAMRGDGGSWPWAGASFVVLASAMAVSVNNRFADTHRQLDRFRLELERMVDERTEELAQSHRRLKSEVGERKLMEEAMHMLERAVEQSIDGIAITDLAGSTQFLNRSWAKLHGYEVFEVLGYDLTLFHSPEQMRQEVYPLMSEVRETGVFQGEVWHRNKQGESFPTWMSVTRVQDPDGTPVGMVAIARDLSLRREQAEDRLRLESKVLQAEKLESLAKLSGGIAHDFNNLLTVILGNTSLVSGELGADPAVRARVHSIEAAAEQAAVLSDRLLASAGEDQKLRLEPLDLNALLEGMRSDLSRRAPSRVELDFHFNAGLPAIDADPLQLRQVVRDLVQNAFESIADGRGVVALRTGCVQAERGYFEGAVFDEGQPAGEYVLFEVNDSGEGIDEQTRTRLFDPFFSTKGGEGRGLGLATALGIVRAHRGAIKYYSQVGRGTTFEVLIPASTRPREVPAEAGGLGRWRGEGVVMVVDDELLVREVAKDILESYDFEVLTAADGREAVEIYRRHLGSVRAVVLDQTMPRMGGVEAFREIRELDPRAVVLLMSGYPDTLSRELFNEGLGGFVHKPFRPVDLVLKLREVLPD